MKISIITPCLNSEKTLKFTLNSLITQDYKNIEHIIVDGGSSDGTLKTIQQYKFKNKKIVIANKSKLYEAINIGIQKSTGEIIAILNSDDIYNSPHTLSNAMNCIKKNDAKIFFGDVVYFRNDNFYRIERYYASRRFKRRMLRFGIMPPHTGSFIHKSVYDEHGLYKEDYKIAGDFEFFLRTIYQKKIKYKIINLIVARMKLGGISSRNLKSYIISSFEILKALNSLGIKSTIFHTLIRLPLKIIQLIIINQDKLNAKFQLIAHKYYYNLFKNNFTIITKINNINKYKNYILSAMNLAFLGSYVKNDIYKYDNLINWPDGIFVKTFKKNIIKIPGRNIIKYLKIPRNITKIKIFGNLSDKSKYYLEKKFNKKIENIVLPYGDIEEIIKKKYFIKKNELAFVTLPTPKQEQFAHHLANNTKNYKVICIGGSIAIAAGEEKVVPRNIYYLEFLWRLRYDTIRRAKRLAETFLLYVYGKYFSNKINQINITIAK
jgi:glycosyltransferase involved in cell wall biosynthesis